MPRHLAFVAAAFLAAGGALASGLQADAEAFAPALDPLAFVEATLVSRTRDGGVDWPAPTEDAGLELRRLEAVTGSVTAPQCAAHAKKAGLTMPGAPP